MPIQGALAASLYNIELLAFEYPDTSQERWPAHIADSDSANQRQIQGELHATGTTAPGIRMLSRKKLAAMSKVLNKQGLPVVAHMRWQQRIAGRNNNRWYQIDEGPLQGVIHLERGRFLHFTADLTLQHAGQTYPIPMQRRFKSGEIHYLDHPKIGILLRADRVYTKTTSRPTQPVKAPEPTAPAQPTTPKTDRPSALPDLS